MSAMYSAGTNAYARERLNALEQNVDVVARVVIAMRPSSRRDEPVTATERARAERLIAAD